MGLIAEFRARARHVVGPAIGVCVVSYFAYHVIHGDRGLSAWRALEQQVASARTELAQAKAEQLYVTEEPNGLVGAFCLQALEPGSLAGWRFESSSPLSPEYALANSLYLTRLAVARRYAGHKLGYTLLDHACAIAREKHKRFVHLDCWAGSEKLRAYYEGAGFDLWGEAEKDYRIAVYLRESGRL